MSQNQPSPFNREPIFWTSTVPGYNDADRQATVMRNGKRVTIKFPQKGHIGSYEYRQKADGTRFLWMIDHHGFESSIVLTCAAAHLNHNDGYGQFVMTKARAFGWFMPGQCPVALLAGGALTADHIVDRSLLKEQPCIPGTYGFDNRCKHSVSERDARAKQNKAIQDEREERTKNDAAKSVEATQALTEKLVESQARSEALLAELAKPRKADK